jgi:endonuclease III
MGVKAAARLTLAEIVDALEQRYGRAPVPPVTNPFEQVVLENASYLVDDQRRMAVFRALEKRIGVTPTAILAARRADLTAAIADGGMRPPMRADKLIKAARIAAALDAPLAEVVRRPFDQAKRTLRRFPGIGEPGAEKVVLFAGAHARLGLESNGLRVLVRLGYAREDKSYDRTWRKVRDAIAPELPDDIRWLQRAHQALRRHGQELCRRTRPACQQCPLLARCPSSSSVGGRSARQ